MMNENNFNENKDLEDLLKSASENEEDQDNKRIKGFKMTPKKAICLTLGVVVSFGIVLGIGGSMMRKQQGFQDETKQPGWIDDQIAMEQKKDSIKEWQFEYPIGVPKWSKQPFSVNTIIKDEEIYEELIKYAEGFQDIKASTAWMPSGVQGNWKGAPPAFTNDIMKATLDNGTKNNRYSYTLKEDYLIAYTTYMQRLINPVFGDWVFYQRSTPNKPYKDNDRYEILKDMFSEEWWNENIESGEDYTSLPILVDWNGDNFGGLEFAELEAGRYGTFYGVINETDNDFVTAEILGQDNRGNKMIKISTPIKYVAFGQNKKPIEKYGVIKLTLGSNDNPSAENNRIIIIDAELILK